MNKVFTLIEKIKKETALTIAKNAKAKLKNNLMVRIYCDGCGAELPKKGSKRTLIDLVETKFSIQGQPRQEKSVYCEDCAEKILDLVKTLKPITIII